MAEIKLEDLWQHCAKCGGKGHTEDVSAGFGMSHRIEQTCPQCGGIGGKITDSGNVLLQFVGQMKRLGKLVL
jgi:DnaJ-class molecular chaperone